MLRDPRSVLCTAPFPASLRPQPSCPTMGKRRFDTSGKQKKKLSREDDATLRITHLWAAAHLMCENSPTLSRFYVSTTRQICCRINLKTDCVTIKRYICKSCNALLIPGLGRNPPRIRHISKPERHLRITCGNCNEVRRFLSRTPGPASDKPASSYKLANKEDEFGLLKTIESHDARKQRCIVQ